MNRGECLQAYETMCRGMIEKDPAKLRASMSLDSFLIHMTGKVERREDYIRDIMDGTLNYYDYEILFFSEKEVLVRLLAKVYGGSSSWWKLSMETSYIEEEGVVKIKECRVRMG